jgi:hypothetical protein
MQDLSHSHLSGHGSGQAKPKPGQSQCLWLGLRISEAKATQSQAKAGGFQAKPSQNITSYGIKDKPLGFRFPTANYDGDEITGFDIRSTACTGSSNNGNPCSQCSILPRKIEDLRKILQRPPGTLNYAYQTHDQLMQSHRLKNRIIQHLKLSVSGFRLFLYLF